MQIAVLGAGAMGSWFGGQLALHGSSVQLLTTNLAHLEAVRNNGLKLVHGTDFNTVHLPIFFPQDAHGPVDLILLFTKSFQSRDALSAVTHIIGNNTHVLSLQNGLGNGETIGQFITRERILLGNSMMPVDKIAPGIVEAKGEGISYFNAAFEPTSPMVKRIIDAFAATPMDVQVDENIQQRIWSKVAFNTGMNALCALTHGTPGTIGKSEGAQQLAEQCAAEVTAVAHSQGINIDLAQVKNTIAFACREHGDHKASMLQDLLAQRPTEVDALNGMIVKLAASAGIDVPLNRTLTTLIKLAEMSYQKQG